jgi:hypothetical protein
VRQNVGGTATAVNSGEIFRLLRERAVSAEPLDQLVGDNMAFVDPLDIITEGCWLALRLGLDVSAAPTENLLLAGGAYRLGVKKTYHPLETVLVGVAASDNWRKDVATTLGVEATWVSGFLDGFAQRPESSTDAEYVQGYLSAEELRIARYRKYLPDRG